MGFPATFGPGGAKLMAKKVTQNELLAVALKRALEMEEFRRAKYHYLVGAVTDARLRELMAQFAVVARHHAVALQQLMKELNVK